MSILGPGFSQYLSEPQQVLRASAALPAAGAWDAAPLTMPCAGWTKLTLFCSYTRGGAAGSVRMAPQFSNAVAPTTWYSPTSYDAGAFAAGADVNSNLQRETLLYTATGAGAETFIYDLELPSNVEYVRCACREVGNVAAPGTMAIVAVLSY